MSRKEYESPKILDFLFCGGERYCIGEGSIQEYTEDPEQDAGW